MVIGDEVIVRFRVTAVFPDGTVSLRTIEAKEYSGYWLRIDARHCQPVDSQQTTTRRLALPLIQPS